MIKLTEEGEDLVLWEDDKKLHRAKYYADMQQYIRDKKQDALNQANLARRVRDEAESRAAQLTAALMKGPVNI